VKFGWRWRSGLVATAAEERLNMAHTRPFAAVSDLEFNPENSSSNGRQGHEDKSGDLLCYFSGPINSANGVGPR